MGMLRRRKEPATDHNAALEAELSLLRQMLLHYPPGQRPTFGAPTRCPSCGDFGFVGGVDPNRGVSFNECFRCRARWIVTRRALRALKAELELPVGSVSVHDTTPVRLGAGLDSLELPSARDRAAERAERAEAAERGQGPLTGADDRGDPRRERPHERDTGPTPDRDRSELVTASQLALPSGPRLDVLLVEDSDLDAELIRSILAPVEGEISLYHASTSKEGKSLFAHRTVDIVLLDLGLPDSSGIDTLRSWRHTGLPIAVVTGDDDLTLASAAKRAGAVEFVPKRRLANLIDDGAGGTEELADIIRRTALSRP